MLGPAINIQRTPLCGRNFEYMGEDPFLTSRIAVGYINGEQSRGVASCVKHFALNNQEYQRNSIDVEADERTLREIYLPGFKAAITEAHAWSIMGAYNKFRGSFCCENDYLLNKILKGEWGFQGIVMSDWGGARHKRGRIGGLDVEMGSRQSYDQYYLSTPFQNGIRDGTYPMSLLDDKVRRSLRVMIATHALDDRAAGSMNTIEHQTAARHVAEQGIVLLKNQENILPIETAKIKTIAVIGEEAVQMQSRRWIGGVESVLRNYAAGWNHSTRRADGECDLFAGLSVADYSRGTLDSAVIDAAKFSDDRAAQSRGIAGACDVRSQRIDRPRRACGPAGGCGHRDGGVESRAGLTRKARIEKT